VTFKSAIGRPLACAFMALSIPLAGAQPPELRHRVDIQSDEILVHPQQDWTATATVQDGPDEHVLLSLEARLHVAGSKGGGCNWVLGILIDDQVLTEVIHRPRLLNKPPFFDFADGKYHFSWFSRAHNAWMTMFADSYDVDTARTGQDTAFLFDLSDYVQPGQSFRLTLHYAQPGIPDILGHEAPLAVRNIAAGTLTGAEVDKLRDNLATADQQAREVVIQTSLDPREGPGKRAYEVEWAQRPEAPPAQVSFEKLEGWEATVRGGGEAAIAASRAQRVWREQVAKVTVGPCPWFTLELRPPEPIKIDDDFNAVNCWVYSNHRYGRSGSPVELSVTVSDSRGAYLDLDAGRLRGDYWEMRQGLAPKGRLANMHPPFYFRGLTLAAGKIQKPLTMYIESLAFWKRTRKPYAKLGRLTEPRFPTSEDNMLPPAPAGCRSEAQPEGQGAVFTATCADGIVRYVVRPQQGDLSDVSAQFGGGPVFQPLGGGAIRFETPEGVVAAGGESAQLRDSAFKDGKLTTRWHFSRRGVEADYELRYQLRGRTLILEASCPGGAATGLDLGQVRGLPAVRAIEVPYLVMWRVPGPRVAMGGGVFVSALVDWYHSQCSVIETTVEDHQADPAAVRINGCTSYQRLTNGRRNDLADRVLLTVSPEFHDTLPGIATPRSDKLEELAPAMFVMSSQMTPRFYETLKRYGLDHIIAIHFAGVWWTRAGEGFSMRWRPRPDLTEQDLADYRRRIKRLGYQWGMLVNYTEFFPGNEYWDENLVCLTSDGHLADGWYGDYRTKPNAQAMLARKVGEKIRARYPTDCVYLDVHTNIGARALDYEAGVEGAGTARATVLGMAEGIHEVHRQQSALCSEGICRWLYAGLADLDYGQWVGRTKSEHKPLLPDFDLLRIHPKQIGTAMGYGPRCFFTRKGLARYNQDPGKGTDHLPFYHYVAATLAHGHSAMIGYGYFPPLARTIHYYSLLAGPQADYLPDTVKDIAWYSAAEKRFVGTSQALRTGVREAGKLRVTYAGGQRVYVNYHAKDEWRLSVDGRDFLLPPYGWIITKPGELLAYSALVDGRRVDYVDCPEYLYLNSGRGAATEGAVTVDGAVLIKRGKALTVIPCGDLGGWTAEPIERWPMYQDRVPAGVPADRGTKRLRIEAARLLGSGPGRKVRVQARNAEGQVVKSENTAGAVELKPNANVVDYVIQ